MHDPMLRRYVLSQVLILFAALNFKPAKQLPKFPLAFITDAHKQTMKEINVRVCKLLDAIFPPRGVAFRVLLQNIIIREGHWMTWKSTDCKAITRAKDASITTPFSVVNPDMDALTKLVGKRMRQLKDHLSDVGMEEKAESSSFAIAGMVPMGSVELARKWMCSWSLDMQTLLQQLRWRDQDANDLVAQMMEEENTDEDPRAWESARWAWRAHRVLREKRANDFRSAKGVITNATVKAMIELDAKEKARKAAEQKRISSATASAAAAVLLPPAVTAVNSTPPSTNGASTVSSRVGENGGDGGEGTSAVGQEEELANAIEVPVESHVKVEEDAQTKGGAEAVADSSVQAEKEKAGEAMAVESEKPAAPIEAEADILGKKSKATTPLSHAVKRQKTESD